MDMKRKKELQTAYRERRPEMGVIALRCRATGDTFLGTATDIPAAFNSIRVKLDSGFHPNRELLGLWKQYGAEGFEFFTAERLEYEDAAEDHRDELETLRDICLAEDPKAKKIWK